MDLSSRQLVLQRLAEVFPDARMAEEALRSLDRYKGTDGLAADAVQLALLKLCEGRLWKLRELVHVARHDFRDVLYAAQQDQKAWFQWACSHGP